MFSAEKRFIEHSVVKDFVGALKSATKKDRAQRIEVRAPLAAHTAFDERQSFPEIFVDRIDPDAGWRRAFVRTLAEADAALCVGGERMTAAIGHTALAFRIPVLALGGFGGAAEQVWRGIPIGGHGASDAEHEAMAAPEWTAQVAERCVTSLLDQITRREKADNAAAEAERKRQRWLSTRAVAGAAILVAALGLVWASPFFESATLPNPILYLVGPVGGIGAALATSSFQESPPHSIAQTGAQGAIAGLLTTAIYLLAQMSAKQFEPTTVTFLTACLTGIGGGFTAEKVIRGWMAGRTPLPAGREFSIMTPESRPERGRHCSRCARDAATWNGVKAQNHARDGESGKYRHPLRK